MIGGRIINNSYDGFFIEWDIEKFTAVNKDKIKNEYISPAFYFENVKWCIKLCNYICGIHLYLYNYGEEDHNFSVKFKFGLKTQNDNMELIKEGFLQKEKSTSYPVIFSQSELLNRNYEPEESNYITVTCRLNSDHNASIYTTILSKPKLEKLMRFDTLSQSLKNLFDSKDNCDTSVVVKDKEFKVHRAILMARSSVFAAMFKHNTSEKQSGLITITDCDPESFAQFLQFLYCGKLQLFSTSNAITLYETSDKYNLQELKMYCKEYLADNLTLENVLDVAILAEEYGEMELFSAASEYFDENAYKILDSSAWDSLVQNHYHISKKLIIQMTS